MIRCGHTVVRAARSAGADPTLESDLGGNRAFHVPPANEEADRAPLRPRAEAMAQDGQTGPVLVLRTLLHTYQVFAGPEGIDEARAIVIDLDVSQPGRYRN